MARTPLLRSFRRLARDFAEAEATGRRLADVQTDRGRGLSRRQVLQAGGMALAGTVLAGPIEALAGSRPRIAIVGGGIAGLNAALTLSDAGIASTVYEAADHVGGRIHSDTTSWLNGQTSEHCGELIDSQHKTILGMAKRFGIPITDLSAAEPPQSTETYRFFGQYYTRNQANIDFNPVWNNLKKDLTSAPFPTLYNSFTPAGFELDHLSLFDWIESRVPGGHASRMGELLDVAYNIEFGNVTTEQSSLNLVYLLGFQPMPGNFRIFGRSDERYHMLGGNQQLPKAIAAALPAGSVQLNTALTGIALQADGTYALTLSTPGGKAVVVADRVIMAIPFSVLRTILRHDSAFQAAGFTSLKQTAIQQLGYGKNCKLQLQFDSRLWNRPGPWGISTGTTYADTGYQNTWEVSRGQDGLTGLLVDYTGGGVPLASFSGGPTDPAVIATFAKTFLRQLEPVFPGITGLWNGRATLDVPLTNPFLLGSYSYWKVGQFTLFSGYEKARQPDPSTGKCHFAGEHCSINFQGFMEGGAEEGARAANEILADYKAGIFP